MLRSGLSRVFDNIVSAKRYLDYTPHALRVVRVRDGVVMAHHTRVSEKELESVARAFRSRDGGT